MPKILLRAGWKRAEEGEYGTAPNSPSGTHPTAGVHRYL